MKSVRLSLIAEPVALTFRLPRPNKVKALLIPELKIPPIEILIGASDIGLP